jgi:hypothetical protein
MSVIMASFEKEVSSILWQTPHQNAPTSSIIGAFLALASSNAFGLHSRHLIRFALLGLGEKRSMVTSCLAWEPMTT